MSALSGKVVSGAQLTNWIWAGLAGRQIVESKTTYFDALPGLEGYEGCALALALVGKMGSGRSALQLFREIRLSNQLMEREAFAELLGIPRKTAVKISRVHFKTGIPAIVAPTWAVEHNLLSWD
jgi:hypothetical protein